MLTTDINKMEMHRKRLFLVTGKKNDVDYELAIAGTKKIFHVNVLKKYEARTDPQGEDMVTVFFVEDTADTVRDEVHAPSLSRTQIVQNVAINMKFKEGRRRELCRMIKNYKKVFFRYARKVGLGEV